jgi:hypothetical protein
MDNNPRRVHRLLTIATIDAQGNPSFNQGRFKFDGKEYPMYTNTTLLPALTSGARTGMTVIKMVDAYTTVARAKTRQENRSLY